MAWKEVLIYVILTIAGSLSIYALSYTRKSIEKNSIHTKIRNVIFYIGIVLGIFGLYELIKMILQVFLKHYF